MSQQKLNSFLKLGYFLDYNNQDISIDISNIDKQKYQDASENELIDIGSKLWKESINSNFISNQKHLVPISGGLDSRAILAGLLELKIYILTLLVHQILLIMMWVTM